jgi:AraC-like DNA-binding protein
MAEDLQLHLYLSRDHFSQMAPALDAACGSLVNTAMGHLFADYLLMLQQHLPHLPSEDLPRLKDAVGVMVNACLASSPDKVTEATNQIDLTRLEKVRCAVRKYLRSPALGPRLLCRCVGASRSQLYRMLECEGGVARYIQQQRLLAAYTALCDPSCATPVTVIAEEFCFADVSGFSRAFRKKIDMTPSDARAAARAGARRVPNLANRATVAPTRFYRYPDGNLANAVDPAQRRR